MFPGPRRLALALSAVLAASCGAAAPSDDAPPGAPPVAEDAPTAPPARDVGGALWKERSCWTCHGADGEGTSMGPALAPLVRRYIQVEESREKARARLVRYLRDPQGVETLGEGGRFAVPMPTLDKLGGGPEDADLLADHLLSLAR